MLVDSATMKAMKISRFERVGVQGEILQTFEVLLSLQYHKAFQVVFCGLILMNAWSVLMLHLSVPASSQLCCIQSSDQGQKQVQRQEGGCGRVLTLFLFFFTLTGYLSSFHAFRRNGTSLCWCSRPEDLFVYQVLTFCRIDFYHSVVAFYWLKLQQVSIW